MQDQRRGVGAYCRKWLAVTRSNLVRVAHCQICLLLQCVYQSRQNRGCKGAVGQHVYWTGKRGGGCIASSCFRLPNLIWSVWPTSNFAFFSSVCNQVCRNRGCKGHWENIWTKTNFFYSPFPIFVSPPMAMIMQNCSTRKDKLTGWFSSRCHPLRKMTILVLGIVKLYTI